MNETPPSPPKTDVEPFFTIPDQVPGPFSATTELDPGAQAEIDCHSALIASHFALAEIACRLIDLAVIAGTLGTSRVILDPLSRVPTPLSMHVLILSTPGSMADDAILYNTVALRDLVDAARRTRSQMKTSGVRARRIELEQISAALIEQIRNPSIPPLEPFRISAPREIAIKDQQIAMLPKAERVAGMLLEHALIENPDILTDVITTKEIDAIRMSPYRGLMSISHGGDALGALMSAPPNERRRIAMMGGWNGGDTSISALWCASEAEARRAMTICEPILRDFLIIDAGATDAEITAPAPCAWDDFVLRLLQVRLQQEVITYELDAAGKSEFLGYVNRTRRMVRDLDAAVVALWPQQVLKVTALLHILAGGLNALLIDAKHVSAAVSLDEVGGTQLRLRSRCAADSLEHQVSVMIAKIRRHGPLTRRQLFRRYDHQDYPRLQAILQAGVDREGIQESGGLPS
jgi:hypothetical protein